MQNDGNYTVRPHYRPCQSICTAVSYAGTSCQGILEGLGVPLGCSDNDISNSFTAYAPDSDLACNGLASSIGKQLVADKTEPYVGEQCAGVTKELLVPSSSTLDPTGTLAPMLPPFVAQAMTEDGLKGVFSNIPRLLKSQCLTDLHKMLCSLKLMKPQPLSGLQAYFGTVYMPQFPERGLCESYKASCGFLVSLVPALEFDCDATIGTIKMFPNETQTITTQLGVPLDTDPNKLVDVTPGYAIASQCPIGLAVPEKMFKGTVMIDDNMACAIQCPLRLYTPKEADKNYSLSFGLCVMSMILALYQLVNVLVVPRAKANTLIIILAFSVFIETTFRGINVFVAERHLGPYGWGPKTGSCASDTAWYSAEDTLYENNTGANVALAGVCLTYANFRQINFYISTWTITSTFTEIWCRVVLGVKKIERVRMMYSGFLGIGAFVIWMVWMIQPEQTWNATQSFDIVCNGAVEHDLDDGLFWHTMAAQTTWAVLTAGSATYKCVTITLRSMQSGEKNPMRKLWKTYRVIFSYGVATLIVFPPTYLYLYVFIIAIKREQVADSVLEWFTCALSSFVSIEADPSRSADKCGLTPKTVYNYPDTVGTQFCLTLTAIALALATSNSDTDRFWWSLIPKAVQDSIICRPFRGVSIGSIMPSDKTSIGDTSSASEANRSLHVVDGKDDDGDDDSEEDEDDSGDAKMKVTTKRVPVASLVSIGDAKAMGENAAKLAAELCLELGKVNGRDDELADTSHQHTAIITPGSSGSSEKASSMHGIDGEGKESV